MLKAKNLICILGCIALFCANATEQVVHSSDDLTPQIVKPYRSEPPFAKVKLLQDKKVEVRIESAQKTAGVKLSHNIKVENNQTYRFEAEVKGTGKLFLAIYGKRWIYSKKVALNPDEWQKLSAKFFTGNIKFINILALMSNTQKDDYAEIRNMKFIREETKVYKDIDVPGRWLEAEQCSFFKAGKIKNDPDASNGKFTWGKRYYYLAEFDLPETSKELYVWGRFKSFAPDTKVHLYSDSYKSSYLTVPNDGKWHFMRIGPIRNSGDSVKFSVAGSSAAEAGLDAIVISTDENLVPESLRPSNLEQGAVTIAPLQGTINVDGKLDEKAWDNNMVLTDFYLKGENKKAKAQTKAMLTYDDKNLYVGIYCEEPSLDPSGNVLYQFKRDTKEKDDPKIYSDDCVAILLGANNAEKGFKDIIINANGIIADADYPAPKFWGAMNSKWDSQAFAVAQTGNGFWTAEVKIPLESIGTTNKDWGFLIGRIRQTDKEISAWQPFTVGWHLPQNLGTLIFGKGSVPIEPAKTMSFDYGQNLLSLNLKKTSDEPLQISATIEEDGKQAQTFTKIYSVGTKELQLKYDITTHNDIEFFYQVSSPESGTVFLQSPSYSGRATSSQLHAELPEGAKLFVNEQALIKGSALNKGINVLALQLNKAGAVQLKTDAVNIPSEVWRYSATEQENWNSRNFNDANWQITDKLDKSGFYRRLVVVEQALMWPNWEQKGLNICQSSTQVLHFAPEGIDGKTVQDYTLVVEVPEFCSIEQASGYSNVYKNFQFKSLGKVQRNGETYNKYMALFPGQKKYDAITQDHRLIGLVLNTAKTKVKSAQLYYYITADHGYTQEVPRELKLNILPEINGKQPQKIVFQLWTSLFSADDKKMESAAVETFTKMGINESASHGNGIKKFRLMDFASWYLDMRPYLKAHPDHALVNYKNDKIMALQKAGRHNYVCPEVLTTNADCKDFLKQTVINNIKQFNQQIAYWDLESDAFTEGCIPCYCPRCLESFKKKNNISGDLTYEIIRKKYSQEWISHVGDNIARIAALFKEYVHAADKDMKFGMYSAYQDKELLKDYSVDWSKLSGNIDFAACGYGRDVTQINATKQALKGTPLLLGAIAYPYKISLREYPTNISKSRLLRRLFDSRYGVLIYSYSSLDGRTFHSIGEATRFASDYEDLILNGENAENQVNIRGIRKGDYYVFAKGEQTMIALFNDSRQSVNAEVKVPSAEKMKEYYGNTLKQDDKTIALTIPPESVRVLVR